MSRLRIVFSVGGMHGGGAERQLVSILKHLDRQKFDPRLYLIYRTGDLLSEVPPDVPITAFEERYTGSRRPRILMHRRRVADMASFLAETQADISYDRTFLMTLIAAEAAQRVHVPNVSTIVTHPSIGFPAVAGRHQWLKRRILNRLYRRSSAVLANSQGAADDATSFYRLPDGTVQVMPNGIDVERIRELAEQPVSDDWWNSSGTDRPVIRLVTAGRLGELKGFHLLIQAVERLRHDLPDLCLRLAILGEGDWRDRLQKQIQQAGLNESVRLIGFRHDAPAWYASADLFVLPSLLEGMPNVLLESLICGTPVVSADCPSGPRELLQDERFGTLCPINDSTALATAIRQVLTSSDLGKAQVTKAAAWIQEQYDVHVIVRRLEQLFTTIAARRRTTSA
ncbi:MAG: glycosyltransferase [Planctomycetaceae bacterium]